LKVIEKQLEIKETENFNSKISINLNSIYLPLENRKGLRIPRDFRKHSWIKIRFDVDDVAVIAVRAFTLLWGFQAFCRKPATIFNAFRFNKAPVDHRDSSMTNGMAMVIKAEDIRVGIVEFGFSPGIQRDKRCNAVML
jgi:hypothetical protein